MTHNVNSVHAEPFEITLHAVFTGLLELDDLGWFTIIIEQRDLFWKANR
jgi:hypothetical protein